MLLTGSQLLFFRDANWVTALSSQDSPPDGRGIVYPEAAPFRPDKILSVKESEISRAVCLKLIMYMIVCHGRTEFFFSNLR